MRRRIFIILLTVWQTLAFATLTTELDPSHAQMGETLRLTFSQTNTQSNAQPDLTPLEPNFTIIGTAQQLSYTAINGVGQSSKQWTILLVAKKEGQLTIPSIQIGSERSAPRQVSITPLTENSLTRTPGEDIAVKLKTSISQPSAYINEQVIYTVKLYRDQPLLNGEYHAPRIENGLFIPLGEGQSSQATLNGHHYTVDEQQYAIFPQKSGPLRITPPAFSGVIYDTIPRRILLKGTEASVEVKPIPTTHKGPYWLPAKKITLSDQYDITDSTIAQGQAVVRTITIDAVGMPAELLPTLALTHSDAFHVYPEKPTTKNNLKNDNLVGTRAMKVTYLFHQAGRVTIPPLELAWFNTQTGRAEHATLAAHTLEITEKPNAPPAAHKPPVHTKAFGQPTSPAAHPRLLWVISIIAIGLTCILITFGWFWHQKRTRSAPVQRICKSSIMQNPQDAKKSILTWAALQWPNDVVLNLSDVTALVQDPVLKQEIDYLSIALYSPSDTQTPWDGHALWRSLARKGAKKSVKKENTPALPPIHHTSPPGRDR